MELKNVEYAYSTFDDRIKILHDSNYPITGFRKKHLNANKPYVTAELKNSIKSEHKIQRKHSKKK